MRFRPQLFRSYSLDLSYGPHSAIRHPLQLFLLPLLLTAGILHFCPNKKRVSLRTVPFCVCSKEERVFFPLSDIMDLRHQSSAMCIIMLGGEDTHPWSATKVWNPIPATIPVDQ